MTNRNRRRFTPRRRTGRDVWVNHDLNEIPVPNTVQIKNLLLPAPDFMTFDTTVNTIIVEDIHWGFDSLAPAGLRRLALGFVVLRTGTGPGGAPAPLTDGVGPPWMGMLHASENLSGVAPQNISVIKGDPIRFKAKRRFRENESSVFLVYQTISPGADTNQTLSGVIRILIHIP